MEQELPKISCLCITRNRVGLLKKSIQLFNNQTHPNKELVIVYLTNDQSTHHFLSSITDKNIKPVQVQNEPDLTLGDLRNISITEANGDYICTWDDDDWFHPERLTYQLERIIQSGKKACLLLNLLMLDNTTGDAYISSRWLWEASMMCARQYILDHNLVYPSVNKREDTYFLRKINSPDIIAPLRNPKMYIYCYTGENTCSQDHFKKLFSFAQKLSASEAKLVSELYNQQMPDKNMANLLDNMNLKEC